MEFLILTYFNSYAYKKMELDVVNNFQWSKQSLPTLLKIPLKTHTKWHFNFSVSIKYFRFKFEYIKKSFLSILLQSNNTAQSMDAATIAKSIDSAWKIP